MRSNLVDAALEVSIDGTTCPYFIVPTEQMDVVANALRDERIHFEAENDAVMLEGRPALSVIQLALDADVERIQGILDGLEFQGRAQKGRPKPVVEAQHELIVKFLPADSGEVLRRLDSVPHDGWMRNREIEERMRRMRPAKQSEYCLIKDFAPDFGDVAIWLRARGASELYVSSVIPLKARKSMSVGQYNHVLKDFEETFIEPLMKGLKRHVFNYQVSREPSLEDVLSTDSMRRLEAFSATANKGLPHALDRQRWRDFIAHTHLENAVIEPSLLSDRLSAEDWPEEQRSRIIDEYELGRSLLSIYEEERVDR